MNASSTQIPFEKPRNNAANTLLVVKESTPPDSDLPPKSPAPAARPKKMTVKEAEAIAGKLSDPDKMPFYSYCLPPQFCQTGAKLRLMSGTACSVCFGYEGFYKFRQDVKDLMQKRLESLNHPLWVDALTTMITHKMKNVPESQHYFRWHSVGDIQNLNHLRNIVEVARRIPGMHFWLQTLEKAIVRQFLAEGGKVPENLTIRTSSPRIGFAVHLVEGLPASVVISGSDKVPVGAVECKASKVQGTCDEFKCRSCWEPQVPLVAFHLHGAAASNAGKPCKAGPAKHVSSQLSEGKLSKDEARQLDGKIKGALARDRRGELQSKLAIAPLVARMTTNNNFKTLGFDSKNQYFLARSESKPYMLALEIVGKSDVTSIRKLAKQYKLSWKRLQIYTVVESDPGKLVAFMEATIAGHDKLTVVDFQKHLKSVKNPDQKPASTKSKKEQEAVGKVAQEASTLPSPMGEVTAEPSYEDVASSFERGMSSLVSNAPDYDACKEMLVAMKCRIEAAYTLAKLDLKEKPGAPKKDGEVMANAPVNVDPNDQHSEPQAS